MVVTSEKLFDSPVDHRYLLVLGICSTCTVISAISGLRLGKKNIRVGQQRTGFVTPDEESHQACMFALALPALACLSLLAVVFVELAPVWKFMEALVVAVNFSMIPKAFSGGIEGTLRLQQVVKDRLFAVDAAPLRIFGHPPCCCLRPCNKPRAPKYTDFPRLKFGVWQFCFVAPCISFIEMIITEELIMHAYFVRHVYGTVAFYFKVVKVISQLYCMSCCKGLAELVAFLSGHPEAKEELGRKLRYCQSYLIGLNLIPTILRGLLIRSWGSFRLENRLVLTTIEMSNFVTSIAISLATVYVSRTAWKAFYPRENSETDLAKSLISSDA